jgi:hypothetical protein
LRKNAASTAAAGETSVVKAQSDATLRPDASFCGEVLHVE